MHEWALAEAILKTSIKVAEEQNIKKLSEVEVMLGQLQDVDKEILGFALESIKKGTVADSAKFEFIEEVAEFKCRNCGNVWRMEDNPLDDGIIKEAVHFLPETIHSFLRCPKCGSADFEVVKGRGVYIKSVKGEK